MEEQKVSFETAELARESGFNVKCIGCYNLDKMLYPRMDDSNKHDDRISAPNQSLLQKWLREAYGIHIYPNNSPSKKYKSDNVEYPAFRIQLFNHRIEWNDNIPTLIDDKNNCQGMYNYVIGKSFFNNHYFDSYEEALEIAIQEALKLIKTI